MRLKWSKQLIIQDEKSNKHINVKQTRIYSGTSVNKIVLTTLSQEKPKNNLQEMHKVLYSS